MDHIAVMIPDSQAVARGFQTIVPRFSRSVAPPYKRVAAGDTIYFKDFGGPIAARAAVRRVEYYEALCPDDIEGLERLYNRDIGADTPYWESVRRKRYGTVIFLGDPEPFPPYWPTRVAVNRQSWIVLDTPELWHNWLGPLRIRRPQLFA